MQTQWDASNSYVQISVTMVMKFKPQYKRLGWTSSLLDISMPSVDHIHNITKLKTVSRVQKNLFKTLHHFPCACLLNPHITLTKTMCYHGNNNQQQTIPLYSHVIHNNVNMKVDCLASYWSIKELSTAHTRLQHNPMSNDHSWNVLVTIHRCSVYSCRIVALTLIVSPKWRRYYDNSHTMNNLRMF